MLSSMNEQKTTESIGSRDDGTEYWQKRWNLGKISFHEKNVNIRLVRYIDELLNKRQHCRIFVPLCGKSLDLKWLADQGHTVVGVECVELAVEEFFSENCLEFTKHPLSMLDGSLYKCTSLPISVYCCDFMEFDKADEESFDAVWDRGSLSALRFADLQRYVEIVRRAMSPDCRYLLITLEYDKTTFDGPPSCLSDPDLQDLFGAQFTIRKLSSENDKGLNECLAPKSAYFNVCSWLLTLK